MHQGHAINHIMERRRFAILPNIIDIAEETVTSLLWLFYVGALYTDHLRSTYESPQSHYENSLGYRQTREHSLLSSADELVRCFSEGIRTLISATLVDIKGC